MKKSLLVASITVSVATIASACIVVEDFEGYSSLDETTPCDKQPCSSSSSGVTSGAGGNSTMAGSSSSGGPDPGSSSSSSGDGSSSSSSGGDSSSSSSSSSGGSTQAYVTCDAKECPSIEGTQGCCLSGFIMLSCLTTQECGSMPMYYCDGKDDCGGSPCCSSGLETKCATQCAAASTICKTNADCPPGTACKLGMGFPFGSCG
ncbi:MAG TPA: hypothetical protein PKA58_20520 [Polyangium sp.]|nr:hypothetical protein [Polyangium sp.]